MVRQSGTTIRKLKAMRSPLAAPTKATPRGHLILVALILLLVFASANRAWAAAEEDFPQKPVTLQTGKVIQAPLFIKEGDVIKIDSRTGKYTGRHHH